MSHRTFRILLATLCLANAVSAVAEPPAPQPVARKTKAIQVTQTDSEVRVETDALTAVIRKQGYVSGIAAGSFLDRKTGASDLGFGLHIMDFILAPGWRDDGYERDPKLHGDLPKHYVEGPQICTQAKQLPVQVIRGEGFVAIRMTYQYHQPGQGYRAGSRWEQTIVFRPELRYVLSAERITSANSLDNAFYRIDMPGHLRHGGDRGQNFKQVYLSYLEKPIPAARFAESFGPDERFLYQRNDDRIPQRMIRAYQVLRDDGPGPWLAGMTLDPAAVSEAWCHQRGYICFIQELHGRPIVAGQSLGAAYIVGWFDDLPQMHEVYDRYRGTTGVTVEHGRLVLDGPLKD